MNMLLTSVGRRAELLKCFKNSLGNNIRIVATDMNAYAPALYVADKSYIVPSITDSEYIQCLVEICHKENINVLTTLIDPEIALLSKNSSRFSELGVKLLVPSESSAALCFDKYSMYEFLVANNIKTQRTYKRFEDFISGYQNGEITFPVFIKPRYGSGSVGAHKIEKMSQLEIECLENSELIIQEFMTGKDIDADVYVDMNSHKPVCIFTKFKLETKIGGANKTISFKDVRLFQLIEKICSLFEFCGPVDMDFFSRDGVYYLSEINPRFGGAYLHAYGAGIDFIKLIQENINGKTNSPLQECYNEDTIMMMYDSAIIRKKHDLILDDR